MSTLCRTLIAAAGALCVALLVACGPTASNPCRGLPPGERGQVKEKYLPCASAILKSMGRLDESLMGASSRDEKPRIEAIHNMADLRSLINQAGGLNRLRTPWADPQLTQLNGLIVTAYEVYAIEMYALAHPVKKLRGEVSLHNVELARRYANQARNSYDYLK